MQHKRFNRWSQDSENRHRGAFPVSLLSKYATKYCQTAERRLKNGPEEATVFRLAEGSYLIRWKPRTLSSSGICDGRRFW